MSGCTIAVNFPARAAEGDDMAGIVRAQFPEADLLALMDDAGAVAGYRLTLTFEDSDAATDAAFALRDLTDELGVEVTWA